MADFIDVKGWKAIGNKLEEGKISTVKEVETEETDDDKLKTGDQVDFDLNADGSQKSLF